VCPLPRAPFLSFPFARKRLPDFCTNPIFRGKGYYVIAQTAKKDVSKREEKLLIPGEVFDLISSIPVRKKLNLVVGMELSPLQSLFDGTSSGKYIDDLRNEGSDVSSD
jgi:hypothetical protein